MRIRYPIAGLISVMVLAASLIVPAQTAGSQPQTNEPRQGQASPPPQALPQGPAGAQTPATPEPGRPETSPQGQAGTAGTAQRDQPAGRAVSVEDELQLTAEQKAKLQPILQDEMSQIEAVRDDTSLTLDQKRAKVAQIKQTGFPKILEILTPEQQKKLSELQQRAKQQDQGSGPGESSGPKPPR